MGDNWPIKMVAECASSEPYSTQIGPFGKAIMADQYTQSGVPVLRGINVNRGRFHDDDFVFIDSETADRLSKFESYPGDVLLVHKGTLGEIGLMPQKRKYPRYIMGNSMMRVRCDRTKLLPEYLYYWLSSPEGQHYIFSRISQVGVPQIQTPLTTLRQAALPVPPLSEQLNIVSILGALDDKIELNRRMNETLEAIARAIFKSWFVDAASHSVTALEDEFNLTMGQSPPGETYNEAGDGLPFFQGRTDFGFRFPEARVYCTAPTRFAEPGDTLVSVRAPVGDINMAKERSCIGRGVAALRHKSGSRSYTYYSAQILKQQLDSFEAEGTVFGSIGKEQFNALQVVAASAKAVQDFERISRPIDDLIEKNHAQSQTLRALRDTLLPKLISGEIRVAAVQAPAKPLPAKSAARTHTTATEQFKEAILIAALTRALATKEFPLGRLRYNKLAYLTHRKTEHDVKQHYLKKAAGPYSPWAKYQGPEKIALQNEYVVHHKTSSREGLIAGPKIDVINTYLSRYDFSQTVGWTVNKFRYRRNDELELLTTVDFAALDLVSRDAAISVGSIKQVIADNPEWTPKLSRTIFSDAKIADAIAELRKHFPDTYGA